MEVDRGEGDWEKGGGRCMRGGCREGRKRDYEDGGKWEKKGKSMQHGTIFFNKKKLQRGRSQQIQGGNRD